MKKANRKEKQAALILLKSTGVNILEAALIAKEALAAGRGKVKRARQCIVAGDAALRQQEKTVTFEKAVEAALKARQDRRQRTLYDFRYFTRRFLKRCPGLAKRRVRSITTEECAAYIETAFDTPCQRRKARLMLSGVFSTAVKRGWCDANPVARVEAPRVEEKTVSILSPEEIEQLTATAEDYQGGSCAAAVGMMLFAGIRPHEVERLTWQEVDLPQHAIYIHPRHSKTGGARRVTIHRPLERILQRHRQAAANRICPPNWRRHWTQLRRRAGWDTPAHRWQQDALRHTFASYHLSRFRSYAELQLEMGHRDATLLRTRYLNLPQVQQGMRYWG